MRQFPTESNASILLPVVTFSRSGTAWSPSTGAAVGTGVPRFEPGGVIVEEASTNLFINSNDFSLWSKQLVTISSNVVTGPLGVQDADLFTTTGSSSAAIYKSSVAAGTYTMSIWAKVASGTQTFKMTTYSATQGQIDSPSFTITTEWKRFSYTFTTTVSSNMYPILAGSAEVKNIYIYEAQLEPKTYSTSNIPAAAITVTRNAETLSFPTAGLLSAAGGSVAGTFRATAKAVQVLFDINHAGSTHRLSLSTTTTTYPQTVVATMITPAGTRTATKAAGLPYDLATDFEVQWDATTLSLLIGGVVVATADITGLGFQMPNSVYLGSNASSAYQLNGLISNVRAYIGNTLTASMSLAGSLAAAALPTSGTFMQNLTAKTGSAPVWILRMTIAGTDYYIADNAITIPAFSGSSPWPAGSAITTKAWVQTWGSVQQGITNTLGEFNVADFGVTLVIAPDVSPNIETMALDGSLRKAPAELYLWFIGCSDPPQRINTWRVQRVHDLSDTTVSVSLQDESILLERAFIGRKLSLADYPLAASADVGKVIPIPFGTVARVPALLVEGGITTTLTAPISAASATCTVGILGVVPDQIFYIDNEQVYVNGVSGYTLTISRAFGGTVATAHNVGAAVVEKRSSPFVYMVSDVPVDSIGQITAEINGQWVDITLACFAYTGQPGNTHASYPGKAVIIIGQFPKVSKAVTVIVNQGTHYHSSATVPQVAADTLPAGSFAAGGSGVTATGSGMVSFNDPLTNDRQMVAYDLQFVCKGIASLTVKVGLYVIWSGTPPAESITIAKEISSAHGAQTLYADTVSFSFTGSTGAAPQGVVFSSAKRTVRTTAADTAQPASGVGLDSSSNVNADTVVASRVCVDLVRNSVADPAVGISSILSMAGFPAVVQQGNFPLGYRLDGCITEYRSALYWCNYLAHQCRSWFVFANNIARLIVRSEPLSVRTIPACNIDDQGRRMLSRNETDAAEIINRINLLYKRDWSQSGTEAYQAVAFDEDSASQDDYGLQERPELFNFDFVTSSAMAESVRDFYLAFYKDSHWRHVAEVPLDQADLEFGDGTTLAFSGNASGAVISAEHYPGSSDRTDAMKLTVLV